MISRVNDAFTYIMAIKVLLFFLLIYIFIPGRFIHFQKEDVFIDRVFIAFIHMIALTIIIVHVLAFLKLYDSFSLAIALLLFYLALIWYRGRSLSGLTDALGFKIVIGLLDISEGRGGLAQAALDYFSRYKIYFTKWPEIALHKLKRPFESLLPLAVLAYASYLRFNHSLIHAYFGASDSYVHLSWVKYLDANQIYHDGIYSYGYHAVISALDKLSLIDPYFIMRFVGPLAGVLLALSVYYFTLRVTRSYPAALVAFFLFGAGIFAGDIWRQISPLPQEFSAIFLLPGIAFSWQYLTSGKRQYLLLLAECLAITVWVHVYVSVYLVLGYTVACLWFLLTRMVEWRRVLDITYACAISVVLGVMPILIGMLMGTQFHGSLGYILRSMGSGPVAPTTANAATTAPVVAARVNWTIFFHANNFFINLSLWLALFMLLTAAAVYLFNRSDKSMVVAGFSLFSIVMYTFARAQDFGLPVLMDPSRTMDFYSLVVCATLGLACYWMLSLFQLDKWKFMENVYSAAVVLAIIVLAASFPTKPPVGAQLEYDGGVKAYIFATETLPALDWIIISPVEQFSEVMGKGWHFEIWQFVYEYCILPDLLHAKHPELPSSQEEASDPQFSLQKASDLVINDPGILSSIDNALLDGNRSIRKIDEPYVYIYLEKEPLNLNRQLQATDINIPMPLKVDEETETYYQNPAIRAGIEGRATAWVEAYKKTHNNIFLVYEDDDMQIYMIYQGEPQAGNDT